MKETSRPELEAYQKERLADFERANLKLTPGQIVFAGDSITEFFPLKKYLGRDLPLLNRGIAGTDSQWLLEHVVEQVLDAQPDKLVLMIGINDIGRGYEIREIVNRISDIISKVRMASITTSIYLLSVLPVNENDVYKDKVKIRTNATVQALNEQLAVLPGATFVDVFYRLRDESGQLAQAYTTDGLHLSPLGYEQFVKPLKDEVLE